MIPVTPEYLSAKGLEILLKNIVRVRKKINPELQISGILYTMYRENLRLTQTVSEIVTEAYGSMIPTYQTRIPYSVKVGESILQGKAIQEYMNTNKVAAAYQELAKEVGQDGDN